MGEYCASERRGPDCDLVPDMKDMKIDFSEAGKSYRDERVKAVFAMAPAVGPGFEPSALASVNIPIYIIASRDDEILNPDHHASHYAEHIPNAELNLLPVGGHFL